MTKLLSLIGIPNPWVILGVIVALAGTYWAGNHNGHKAEAMVWQAVIAQERIDAANLQAAALARNAALEAKSAERARNLDKEHSDAIEAIAASRDDFARRLRLARQARPNCLPATAVDSVKPADTADRGDGGRGGPDPADRLRTITRKLQEHAKLCTTWVNAPGVGR